MNFRKKKNACLCTCCTLLSFIKMYQTSSGSVDSHRSLVRLAYSYQHGVFMCHCTRNDSLGIALIGHLQARMSIDPVVLMVSADPVPALLLREIMLYQINVWLDSVDEEGRLKLPMRQSHIRTHTCSERERAGQGCLLGIHTLKHTHTHYESSTVGIKCLNMFFFHLAKTNGHMLLLNVANTQCFMQTCLSNIKIS